jgi:hypothetical protein
MESSRSQTPGAKPTAAIWWLLPVVDDVDDRGRHVADDGGQLDQSLEVRLGRFAQDVVLLDGLTTCQVLD